MLMDYVHRYHLQDCINIINQKDELGYYSIKIDFLKLFETYPDVGDKVLCSPVESLASCDEDLIKVQQNILEQLEYKETLSKLDYCCLKRNVHARFYGLPVCPELHRTVFPKNVDLGCFLKVTGTIVRLTQAKMLEYQRKYVCVKCKFENTVEAKFENRYVLKAPSKCGNDVTRCKSFTFTQVNLVSRLHCKDYQEIKIQEQVNKLSIGTIPGSMWVVLEDDLVDCSKPGDDVNICGTVRRRWRPSVHNKKSEVELVLQANYTEVCNAQRSQVIATAPDIKECFNEYWSKFEACPLKGRDKILLSVCPQVYGLHLVKLALLLTVITGSNNVIESENDKKSEEETHATRVRGQCHLLLVGDPGTGKSQLLRAGAELTPRSVFTSGAGSTRAGLTCAALREDGEWQLEAGALVLSDGGVCCIDEISQLRDHDRTAIHEAMEQQTISIAKAGIVCKLNTRSAVIAACNPKGHYETDQPLSVNVSLGTPLLSRFDLIFILLDSKNKAWDKLVSSYILFGGTNGIDSKKQWNLEKLQMYISLVGPWKTQMTKSANIILQSYYMMQRKSEYRDPSRTTVRMLDSLFRLSQAHCRLMYRNVILPVDAIVAISLMDLSMQDCTLEDTVDALHSTFQKYPDFDYLNTAKKLLIKLNLYQIWQEELLRYAKLLQVDHKTLESEIDKNSYQFFAKYDDIADDNIPLPASLVTSSYFNSKKFKETEDNQREDLEQNKEKSMQDSNVTNKEVSEKLAKTLKKHAALNKSERKLPVVKNKRKRKEVTVDTSLIKSNTVKRKKNKIKKESNSSDSDNDIVVDPNALLNAVPSVNDVFADIEMDFGSSEEIYQTDTSIPKCTKNENIKESNPADKPCDNIISKELNKHNQESNILNKSVNTLDKLKQFQFIEKNDLSKFYCEKVASVPSKSNTELKIPVTTLMDVKSEVLTHKSSVSSSQLSMFESSDCDDADLDI